MKFLIVGLGSMGKRRIRCLYSIGYSDIIGYDIRSDRLEEASSKYKIETINSIDEINLKEVDCIIISTPPDIHNYYIKLAISNKIPAFVEASVVLEGLEELNDLSKNKKVLIGPSCTMKFHPAIKDIAEIINSGKFGKVSNFSYHSGQYLPDWHPWEDVKDFYVSKKETGGCREIVPFELTWIVEIFGFPENIVGFYGHTIDVGADIDDTYVLSMNFKDKYGSMLVDVTSRYAIRSLIVNLEFGQIVWRWDENCVKLYDAKSSRWINYQLSQGISVEGYNKNIIENMYIDEIKAFISSIVKQSTYPNSLDEDIKVLKLLEKAEAKSCR
jgi:predicted dehydrogenase